MWCAPGNAGIAQERLAKNGAPVECVNIGAEDLPKLLAFAQEKKIDLTVVGPDNPLALGIVDLFQKNGLRIWGPNQKAAQFESSKVFSQKFMEKYGIPTAPPELSPTPPRRKKFAASLGGKCAVKADGLALGKGVLICANLAEAEQGRWTKSWSARPSARRARTSSSRNFSKAWRFRCTRCATARRRSCFPTSQDHKRALDGDLGLNTGGMGTYSPTPFLTDAELTEVGDANSRTVVARLRGGGH